jgi:hypothetical protein
MGKMTLGEEIYESTNNQGVNLKVLLKRKEGRHIKGAKSSQKELLHRLIYPPRMADATKLVFGSATGVGSGGIPPAPTIGLGKKIVTRSEKGLCVGMSALWCVNLIKGEKDPGNKTIQEREKETKPIEGGAFFIQARWDQIFKKQWGLTRPEDWHRKKLQDPYPGNTVRVKEELMEFKAFLEGIGMGVEVTVPAKVQLDHLEIDRHDSHEARCACDLHDILPRSLHRRESIGRGWRETAEKQLYL